MDFNIDQLKKKIIYRSTYRGTKEMDKLLGTFTNNHINNLTYDDLFFYLFYISSHNRNIILVYGY